MKIQDLRPMVLASFTLNWEYSITSSSWFFQCKYPTFHVKLTSKSQGWKYVGKSFLEHSTTNTSTCEGWVSRCGVMAWWLFQTCIENVHHYTAASYWTHPGNVGDVWKENASTPSPCHCLTNSPGHHGLSTPLASPTKVVFRKLGRSRQPWLSPITFFTRLEWK